MGTQKYKKEAVIISFGDHFDAEQSCEATEWHNGEGCDISINEDKIISLTWSQVKALVCVTSLIHLDDAKSDK
jgi:hypothetical protein